MCDNPQFKILSSIKSNDYFNLDEIFANTGEVEYVPEVRDLVLAKISTADAYLASASVIIDEEFLACAKKLKLIGSPSTGTDHMDMDLLKRKGVTVLDIAKERELLNQFTATSELTFALMLNLSRNIIPASADALTGRWGREQFSGFQLFGKTLGIIGLGRLGSISSKIGSGFGMNVIGHDPNLTEHDVADLVSFEQLLTQSDVISLHLHLNKATENLISTEQFRMMKKNSILINTSRGKIVDETALISALEKNLIAGAGLDVIDGEWLLNEERMDHPLIKYANENKNLLIVPHIGGSTVESINGARIFMAKKMVEVLKSMNGRLQV